MENEERDFVSPVLEAAIAMHELFTTLIAAGFKESQALVITVEMLKNSGKEE